MNWKINLSSFLRASIPSSLYAGLCAVAFASSVFVAQACAATSTTDAGDRTAQLDKIFPRATQFRVGSHPKFPSVLRVEPPKNGDGSVTSAWWCAPGVLLFYYGHPDYHGDKMIPKSHGVHLMDVRARAVWRAKPSHPGSELVQCSIDGNWFLHARKIGKDTIIGRIHLHTGKSEDIARFNKLAWRLGASQSQRWPSEIYGTWSPNGRVLAYKWGVNIDALRMGEPAWLIYLPKKELPEPIHELVWLDDSTRVLIGYSIGSDRAHIPRFATGDIRNLGKPYQILGPPRGLNGAGELRYLKRGPSSTVYGVFQTKGPSGTTLHLRQCVIDAGVLNCKPVIDGDPNISSYSVSTDGTVILYKEHGSTGTCKGIARYAVISRKKDCPWPEKVFNLSYAEDGDWIAMQSTVLGDNGEYTLGVLRVSKSANVLRRDGENQE